MQENSRRADRLPRPQITLTHRPAGHLQHPVQALLRLQPQAFLDLDPRGQIAQRQVQFLQRVERQVGADVAAALAVGAGRADEDLAGDRQLHLVDDVRLGGDDQGVAREGLGELQDAAGRADIVGVIGDVRWAFGVRGDRRTRVPSRRTMLLVHATLLLS